MDKETLSNYGWIVICVLVLAVMIALASPFGSYVASAVENTTQGLFDVEQNALEVIKINNAPSLTFDSLLIYYQDNSCIYAKDGDETKMRTSVRYIIKYECPIIENEIQADKIFLKDGTVATILERNIIYKLYEAGENYTDFSETTSGVYVSKTTGTNLFKVYKYERQNSDKANIYFAINYANISKSKINTGMVIRAKIKYQTESGEIQEFYSDIYGADGKLNAQYAYEKLCSEVNPSNIEGKNPTWFE